MARMRVKLSWIREDSSRRATFKKRRAGLLKKTSELSTLCGIETCAIIYGHREFEPEVYPAEPADARRILARFKSLPQLEKSKKMVNQEGFLRQQIAKLDDQIRKQESENQSLETILLMHQGMVGESLDGASVEELESLSWLLKMKVKEAQEKIKSVNGKRPLETGTNEAIGEEGNSSDAVFVESLKSQDNWFMDAMNPLEGMGLLLPYFPSN